ncbi:ADP-ribosylation factor-like protein [candidate division KSB1 bacterium]|nr:ADP-ribosylation factor-like protein [candidate division KSB1 bacterium]
MAKDEQKPMTREELLAIIEQARRENWEGLDLRSKGITELPPEIGQLKKLKRLDLGNEWNTPDELDNKLTQLPEEIGQLNSLQTLDLTYVRLTALPESVGQLKSLKTLDLTSNELTALPESIGLLTDLQTLDLLENQLTALPESIGQLTCLHELCLRDNKLTTLPVSIGQLTCLQRLDLGINQLTVLPEFIGQLTSLQQLYLDNNQLTVLPEFIGQFTSLQTLRLAATELTALPESIGRLTNLESLDISYNTIKELPNFICYLSHLKALSLTGNDFTEMPESLGNLHELEEIFIGSMEDEKEKIEKFPTFIRHLKNLKSITIHDTEIQSVPDWLGTLTQIEVIDLSGNKVLSIPSSIARLEKLKDLQLDGNPLNPALQSAYDQGLPALMAYLRSLEQAEPLYESKLVLVGEGGVGKTTLLKALTGKEPKQNEPTTHGVSIDIHSMQLPHLEKQGVNIQFNAWDFGGQEVYRVTHQFFFSKRSVYLLVWEPRMGVQQCQVEDWLKLIRLRVGDDAKVIIISTHAKTGERIARIDQPVFLRDYGSMIVDFIEVDSLEPDPQNKNEKFGIATLKQLIADAAQKLEHMGTDFGKAWKEARDELIELGQTQPHVAYAQFAAVCEKHGLESIGTRTLAGIMHDLGYIVYYGDDERLRSDVVLQPEWLTKAIGFVLEDRKTQEMDGILPDNRLREVLFDHPFQNEPKYPMELYPFFLRLMEKYDVSYRLESGEASLVAQHVPQVRPALPWQPEEAHHPDRRRIAMVCVMEESPPGLVPWMIVRTHEYAYDSNGHRLHWQKGAFLKYKD